MLTKLDTWHQTRPGLLVFGLVELLIAYGFLGLVIDRGNPWWYGLTLLFTIGFVQNFVKLISSLRHGKK